MKCHFFLFLLAATLSLQGCDLFIAHHNDTTSYTPFMVAVSDCESVKVKNELERQPDQVNDRVTDMAHASPLHLAVDHGCIDVIKVLLVAGADVNATEDGNVTPLHLAAQTENVQMIALLLDHHAELEAIDANGLTPLDRAKRRNKIGAINFLLSKTPNQ